MKNSPLSRNRDFRLLWISGLLTTLGAQLSSIALPLLVLRQTGSAVVAGAVGTVSVGALLVTMLPGGALADAVERRRLVILCESAIALAAAVLAGAVLLGGAPLPLILAVTASGAVLTSLCGPAALGLLRTVVPEEQLATASSRIQARSAATRLAGPAVGGALFAWHPALPFAAEAVGLLLSVGCLALVRARSVPARRRAPFSRRELTAGVVFVLGRPYLRTALLVFGLGMNAAFSAMMFTALTVASDGGSSGVDAGLVVSLTSVGSLLGALLAPRVAPKVPPGAMIAATCWACTAAAGVLLFHRSVLLMGLLVAACLAVAAVANIGFLTSLLTATPEDLVGRVQSAASFVSSLVVPLGPLAAGTALTLWGPAAGFGAVTAVFALCAVVITVAPSMRRPLPAAGARGDAPGAPDAPGVPDAPGTSGVPGSRRPPQEQPAAAATPETP
ncbi:MFS transporter [Streptomyces sp. HB2AG]|uniref:MFS transporter n=1 Tax=Streptomyces sp. HB2AG TaxID=2983400 RepID=UPI0022AA5CE2|nr:MFS transporter [Streptomyces sp. HB2AG]MCZ2526469.1 MFS transporter [Streptomyces sp. HB2AG]